MKKLLVLTLVIIFALPFLFSCGGNGDDDKDISDTEVTFDEDGFAIFPEGDYLTDMKFATDEYLPDYDADISFQNSLNYGDATVCSDSDTVYFTILKQVEYPTYVRIYTQIMYYDKNTAITSVLCGKPECMHDDDTCNAYISGFVYGFGIYDGKLYYIADDYSSKYNETCLFRMNLDGTAREKVKILDQETFMSGPYTLFHRGYIYILGDYEWIEDGEEKRRQYLIAEPLGDGETVTLFDTEEGTSGKYSWVGARMAVSGKSIYLLLGDDEFCDIYRWDAQTMQRETLCHLDATSLCWDHGFLPVSDGIYFSVYDVNYDGSDFGRRGGICKYSYDTGELGEYIWPKTDDGRDAELWPDLTENYIVSWQGDFRVWDLSGNFIFSSIDEIDFGSSSFMGADSENVYIWFNDIDEETFTEYNIYVVVPLDGSDVVVIGQDQPEL